MNPWAVMTITTLTSAVVTAASVVVERWRKRNKQDSEPTAPMSMRPRVRCPRCNQNVLLGHDGRLVTHLVSSEHQGGEVRPCEGSRSHVRDVVINENPFI